MSRTPCSFVPSITALLVLFLVGGSASAQTLSSDEKELAAYRLTMATVKKVAAATQALAEEAARDPRMKELNKVKAEMSELTKKEELTEAEESQLEKLREREQALQEEVERAEVGGGDNNKTLGDMEAAIKKHPAAMRALAAQGLTPREYATCLMALLQAAIVEGFSQGKADVTKLPAGINPENVRFVRENKTELEALQSALTGKPKR